MSNPLSMVQLQLDVPRVYRLFGLQEMESDPGYMVHSALKGLFGEVAPQPFAIQRPGGGGTVAGEWEKSRQWRILGYSRHSAQTMREHAATYALPDRLGLWIDRDIQEKTMPLPFALGRRLGFQVRVCPVVRKKEAGRCFRAGQEIDAYLAAVEKTELMPEVDCQTLMQQKDKLPFTREEIYREWFQAQWQRIGGADLHELRLEAMVGVRLARRGEHRQVKRLERREVLFAGELTVTDPGGFAHLLERGIGRHRAFGFGMVLLRPPG